MSALDDLARELYAADDAYNAAWSARMAAGVSSNHPPCCGDVPSNCASCRLLNVEHRAAERLVDAEGGIIAHIRAQRPR